MALLPCLTSALHFAGETEKCCLTETSEKGPPSYSSGGGPDTLQKEVCTVYESNIMRAACQTTLQVQRHTLGQQLLEVRGDDTVRLMLRLFSIYSQTFCTGLAGLEICRMHCTHMLCHVNLVVRYTPRKSSGDMQARPSHHARCRICGAVGVSFT